MEVIDRTLHDLSFAQRRGTLERALEREDEDAALTLVRGYEDLAAEAIAADDLEAIASLRGQIARLARRARRQEETAAAQRVLERFEGVGGQLDRREVVLLLQAAEREREQAAEPIRMRVLTLLGEGRQRPRELAERLHCDPSQISRALRELKEEGAVEQVTTSALAGDRRAIYYALKQPAGAPA